MIRYCIVFILFLSPSAKAFNFVGHVTIAQAAYERLDRDLQLKLDKQAQKLISKYPGQRNPYSHYNGVSDFAKIAIGPDTWTGSTIEDLYSAYGATYIQNTLWRIKGHNTKNWHYINYNIDSDSNCDFIKEDNNILWAMEKLQNSYGQHSDLVGQGIVLSSIIHFVADAHQPLHAAARDLDPSNSCQSDFGGNRGGCLKKRGEKCDLRLHAYWDRNANLWTDKSKLREYVSKLNSKISTLSKDVSIEPKDWIDESLSHAEFAYSTPSMGMPDDAYQAKAHEIITDRMALAAIRLAVLLEAMEEELNEGLDGSDHQ